MKFAWSYLFVLIWIAYLISAGVFLFSRGFLLSRVSQTDFSTCRKLSNDENAEYFINDAIVNEVFKDVNASASLCLPKKTKVIILLIDALKYEFGVYKPDLANPQPYENKLKIINELLQKEPEKSKLLKFQADPPTTTMQRLKGLTTGSLPTFIDIGSNFATPEINEDNIIDQMVKSELPVVFMGDSTWTDLYPKRFKRQYSYPSFDIFDLDTIDNKIRKHLPKELMRNDWDVLIAHFLGVDHCGHRYGPLHKEMSRKLNEMDDVIRSVIKRMDEKTTLIVMGDHGMTITGDHGGDTDDETGALLFAYSKGTRFISSDYGSDNASLQQIDLVPTLSAILGISIPFSNLGIINYNIVPDVKVPHMMKYQILLLHAWQNAKQIYTYFSNYAKINKRTFNFDHMDEIDRKFILLTHRVNTIYNDEAFKSFIKDLNIFLREILYVCRNIWVKFDPNQMSQGLLFTFLPIFFAFLLIHNSKALEFSKMFTLKSVLNIYLINIASGVFGYRYFNSFSLITETQGVVFFTSVSSTVIFSYLTLYYWPDIAMNWSQSDSFTNIRTRFIYCISIGLFFSNSFIINEQKILSYLIIAIIILINYDIVRLSYKFENKSRLKLINFLKSIAFKLILASILAIGLLRTAYNLFQCREELGNCTNFLNDNKSSKVANKKIYLLAVVVLVMYITLTRLYLRSCGNLTGTSINVMLARFGPTVAVICASGHIVCSNSSIKTIKAIHIDTMALVIYALFLIQIIIMSISPLMTFVLPPRTNTISVNPHGSVIPEIFKKMKNIYQNDNDSNRRNDIPVVYGLATVYSSALVSFGSFLAVLLVILLEPKSSIGIILCIIVAAVLLIIHSIIRYKTATNFETCIQPTFTAIIGWFLISHFCFFATSHQTTFSQIDWRAAFVGRTSNYDNSVFISGILVILNTFCGQVFFMGLFGLLPLFTFAIYALYPTLAKSNVKPKNTDASGNDYRTTTISKNDICESFDITRGELILYENDKVYLGSIFKLGTQFFILQGLRVFCAMLSCTIHCRHLMVWKIFAPRFIYEALSTFIGLSAIVIGYLIIVRIHWSLERLIIKINKSN